MTAMSRAYAHVLTGFLRALETPDLPEPEVARLERMLKAARELAEVSEDQPVVDAVEEWRERGRRWRRTPWHQRERLALEAIGDRALTAAETLTAMREALPDDIDLYMPSARHLLRRLVAAGELERQPEPFRGQTRYRYLRRVTLDGPIADLDRAWRDS